MLCNEIVEFVERKRTAPVIDESTYAVFLRFPFVMVVVVVMMMAVFMLVVVIMFMFVFVSVFMFMMMVVVLLLTLYFRERFLDFAYPRG